MEVQILLYDWKCGEVKDVELCIRLTQLQPCSSSLFCGNHNNKVNNHGLSI